MDYYKLLQLKREPFSNSPDPDYFFQSRQHLGCMQKLELALRLKRGLNVVIGDVGTGKTTLCRQLIRKFSNEDQIESHLILDPSFATTHEFLLHIHELICGRQAPPPAEPSDLDLKERIKQALFQKGVDQDKTTILIIDEGQKISEACVEILREFLNYETNDYKLLQIVIFAQLEFDEILQKHANFSDRINMLHHLTPMDFKDTRQMVHHRLKLSSEGPQPKKLFTLPAMWAIYRASRGYPRKIIHLCHQSMLAMIIQNRSKAGWSLIQSCKQRIAPAGRPMRKFLFAGASFAAVLFAVMFYAPDYFREKSPRHTASAFKIYQDTAVNSMLADAPMTAVTQTPPSAPQIEQPATAGEVPAAAPPSVEQPESPAAPSPDIPEPHTADAPADPAPMQLPPTPPQPPAMLGKLIVKPGDTLVAMVYRVYSSYHPRHLQAVIEANAYLENPNRIDIGNVIQFPPLPFDIQHRPQPVFWVILEEHRTLPSAMQRLHEITREIRIPLQLLSSWSPATGLQFQLLVKGYFTDDQAAMNYIQALPENVSGKGRVLSEWPEEIRLFSDPYSNGAH